KSDRVGANINKVLSEIKMNLSEDVLDVSTWTENSLQDIELIESLAERDEELLKYYLENGYSNEEWVTKTQEMIKTGKTFPCTFGSALQDIGIREFLDMFNQLTITTYNNRGDFQGRVFKIRYDISGNR